MKQQKYFFRLRLGVVLMACCSLASPPPGSRAQSVSPLDEKAIKKTTDKMNVAIQSGVAGHLYPGQFNKLFTNAVNGISYYTGEAGHPKWYSKAGIHDRYVLRMVGAIELDQARTNIVSMEPPTFALYELTKITGDPVNGPTGMQVGKKIDLSPDTWKRLVAANGDFHAVGITLETNKPVGGFGKAWPRF